MNEMLTKEIADLQLFADPFEEFKNTADTDGWTARFARKGHDVVIKRESNGVVRTLSGPGQRQYRNFKGLLVSETFADLERLASAQRYRSAALLDPSTGSLKEFLPIAGEIRWGDGRVEPLNFERVCQILDRTENCSRVVVIDGGAGVGKSHLIERLVCSRAEPSSYKSGKPLLLHVESRGKVLTSLNDRIAGTLSSLRASFVEEELKPLLRRDAVQLAIDGFDELSDSRGYDRAWGALQEFIRDLRGRGTCILAGRDTMLDLETVRHGLGKTVSGDTLILLRLQDPPVDDIESWLRTHEEWRDGARALSSIRQRLESSEYLRRPFFVSRIADLGPDYLHNNQGEPIAELMESIVRREGGKMASVASDVSAELASRLCGELLAQVACLMMDDESNEIEIGYVELLLEDVFTDQVNLEMVHALVQRAKAVALLEEVSGDQNKRRFPHETIRSYFFGQSVFEQFPEQGATTGLYRVPLSAEDFRIFNRVARRRHLDEQRRLRECLLSELPKSSDYDYLRSNIGGLLLAFAPLAEDEVDDELELSRIEFRDVWIGELVGTQRIHLKGCFMNRLDVRGADLREVRFSNTEVYELLADPFVKFGSSVPVVRSIIVYEHFKETRLREGISEWIAQKSDPVPRADTGPDERWYLLERFARISMRQYSIRSGEDQMDAASRRVIESPHWESLCALLDKHGRLEVSDTLSASGPKSMWFHLVAGHEFLNARGSVQDSTRRILDELNVPTEQ